MKRFTLIFALILLLLQTKLSFSNDDKTFEKVDLKKKLERLKFLLETDSEGFYLEANAVESLMRQEADLAIDYYKLLSEYHYAKGEHETVISNLHQAKSFIKENNVFEFLKVNLDLGTAFYFLNIVDSMEFYLNIVTDQIDQKDPIYPEYLLAQGMKNQLVSNYLSSIETIIEAIKILEQVNDKRKLATAYNNLAINYGHIDRLDLQLEYLLKAVTLNEELGNGYKLIMNYNNLGVNYKNLKDLEKSIYYYELAYNELLTFQNPFLLAQNLMNRANVHVLLEEYQMAEKLFLECEAICEGNQILHGTMLTAINLGDLYRKQKKFSQSEIKLQEALMITRSLKAKKEEGLVIQNLSNLAKDRKDFETALSLFQQYHFLNDSILNQKVKTEASELREKYETEKKENEIISLSQQKLYQQYFIALVVVALLIFFVLAQGWRNKHRIAKENLNAANKLTKVKEETIAAREKDLMDQVMEKVVLQEHLNTLLLKIENQNYESLATKVKSIQKKQNPWDGMLHKFQMLHPEFINSLTKNHPVLSKGDVEFCSLVRMNLSNKEIAQMLHINVDSVFTKKYRIMKKLDLPKDTDFTSFLHSL